MGRNFRNNKAWILADNLVVLVYRMTKSFPKEETYGLVSQMRRSAISVASNIVEGCARESKKDNLRFLYIALASLTELEYHFHISKRLNYLDENCFRELRSLQKETAYALDGLIKSVQDELVNFPFKS